MPPWADRIVFTESAVPNIGWLRENLADAPGEWHWEQFWDLVADLPCYQDIDNPRRRLAVTSEIRTLSIFDLPTRTWELGSMFFVVDSMSTMRRSSRTRFARSSTPSCRFAVSDGLHGGLDWLRRPQRAVSGGQGNPRTPSTDCSPNFRDGHQHAPDGQLHQATQTRL